MMDMSDPERRRSNRIRLQVPMFIRGMDAHGDEFLDLTKTLNISSVGAYLASPRPLKSNEVISLKIPAPSPSNSGLIPEPTPTITARVRRSVAAGDVHLVAVEFLKSLD
ncbi:MAG TPA: PilZ domain-containing protein [Candidatus Acidoferrum sp.]|nr:PilZ domain-containing protein [Candidatus Acidoferrum sp.]